MSETTRDLLAISLETFVPLEIARLRRDGLRDWEWAKARAFAEDLGAKGDQLLYRGPETARLWGELARALAVLAFAPGGVAFAGLRFEAPS